MWSNCTTTIHLQLHSRSHREGTAFLLDPINCVSVTSKSYGYGPIRSRIAFKLCLRRLSVSQLSCNNNVSMYKNLQSWRIGSEQIALFLLWCTKCNDNLRVGKNEKTPVKAYRYCAITYCDIVSLCLVWLHKKPAALVLHYDLIDLPGPLDPMEIVVYSSVVTDNEK